MIYRIVTASSLFDGHDAAINLYRKLLQKAGVEVIHLGHNRSVDQIVRAAVQEDVNAVCVSSYQGGHMEFFRYLRERLCAEGADDVAILGGGGGTILPSEIAELQAGGITRLYHADDGRKLGLRGIIKDALGHLHPVTRPITFYESLIQKIAGQMVPLTALDIAKGLSLIEEETLFPVQRKKLMDTCVTVPHKAATIGVTGPGGAGKSSLVDELLTRFLYTTPQARVAVLTFDPTKLKTGGALLGDRLRMNAVYNDRVFLRSVATRGSANEVGQTALAMKQLLQASGFDLILIETTGIGQGGAAVVNLCDLSLYVMTNDYGSSTQLEKIDMLDFADSVALNKFDKIGAEDALEDVRHAYASSRNSKVTEATRSTFPIFGTIASNFNDPGVTRLFKYLVQMLQQKGAFTLPCDLGKLAELTAPQIFQIVPSPRTFYLGEIAKTIRAYKQKTQEGAEQASRLYALETIQQAFTESATLLKQPIAQTKEQLGEEGLQLLETYHRLQETYQKEVLSYQVRDKVHQRALVTLSLSELKIPKVATPSLKDWGEIYTFMRLEGFPGHFPFTAGVFQVKSEEEEPRRQFAGEGAPERTNKRFHYLSRNDRAKRLSTAFDSVTLYGEDPALRPDIYGKIGNSGVSIATLDDMKALYAGFDLVDPLTSVSLTINGPAPMILAMFLNTAIDFEVEKMTGQKESGDVPQEQYRAIKKRVLESVRGTVQADILKEEQAQNTCIFSSKFALKMMGDIEEYFIKYQVRNFYSVSISGYHIAEAGANPISQLAFTLSNGFTFVEYYLSRGMKIDDFAHNLSFFFSSGLDPEYAVIGRVARRIWAIAMREKYGANPRSCKLKYHIQTSGRSLHAQEIAFNDIRTTLQALLAVYDNCNSLHTNAYDEAITTPTEESVRRAMAIQLILAKEFGVNKCDNPMQGSYFYEALTELVEEAVLEEFDALSRRGGVLGAMEKQYQRHRIQSESMKYEMLKGSGEYPVIGVNTFLGEEQAASGSQKMAVVRATEEEKQQQIARTQAFIQKAGVKNRDALEHLHQVALSGGNIFEELMETVKYASLGQISSLLYTCGGEYRRSQ